MFPLLSNLHLALLVPVLWTSHRGLPMSHRSMHISKSSSKSKKDVALSTKSSPGGTTRSEAHKSEKRLNRSPDPLILISDSHAPPTSALLVSQEMSVPRLPLLVPIPSKNQLTLTLGRLESVPGTHKLFASEGLRSPRALLRLPSTHALTHPVLRLHQHCHLWRSHIPPILRIRTFARACHSCSGSTTTEGF